MFRTQYTYSSELSTIKLTREQELCNKLSLCNHLTTLSHFMLKVTRNALKLQLNAA